MVIGKELESVETEGTQLLNRIDRKDFMGGVFMLP